MFQPSKGMIHLILSGKESLFIHLLILFYLLVWACMYDVCICVQMCIVHACVCEYRHAGAKVCLHRPGYLAWELWGNPPVSPQEHWDYQCVCTMSRFTWVLMLWTQVHTLTQSIALHTQLLPKPENLSLIKSSLFVFQVTAKLMRLYLWVWKRWGVGVFNKQLKDQHIIHSSFCIWL